MEGDKKCKYALKLSCINHREEQKCPLCSTSVIPKKVLIGDFVLTFQTPSRFQDQIQREVFQHYSRDVSDRANL